MMETHIADFHTSFYIPEIQKSSVSPSTRMNSGDNHCGNTRRESFKRRSTKQYVSCCRNYYEIVVDSFAHQIQSE